MGEVIQLKGKAKKPQNKGDTGEELATRIEKIKQSIERINKLMAELRSPPQPKPDLSLVTEEETAQPKAKKKRGKKNATNNS